MPGAQTDGIGRDVSHLAICLGQVLLYNVLGMRRSLPIPLCLSPRTSRPLYSTRHNQSLDPTQTLISCLW